MISKDGHVGWEKVHEVNFLPPQLSSFTKLSSFKDHTFTVSSLTDTTYSLVGSQHKESTSLVWLCIFQEIRLSGLLLSDLFSITGEL
jgi:hypothetical protein